MKSMLRLIMLLLASGALASADAAAGGEIYAKKCKGCHGADGKGNPGISKAMKVTLRDLGSKEVQARSNDDLKKVITQGTGKMKPIAGISATEAADVIAFVRTLK